MLCCATNDVLEKRNREVVGTQVLLLECVLGSSITHYCVAHEPFWFSYTCALEIHSLPYPCFVGCPVTRGTADAPIQHRTVKDGHHPRKRTPPRKGTILGGASGILAAAQASTRANITTGMRAERSSPPTTLQVPRRKVKTVQEEMKEAQKMVWQGGTAQERKKERMKVCVHRKATKRSSLRGKAWRIASAAQQ